MVAPELGKYETCLYNISQQNIINQPSFAHKDGTGKQCSLRDGIQFSQRVGVWRPGKPTT
jgi:hypothetical protein